MQPLPYEWALFLAHILFTTKCLGAEVQDPAGGCTLSYPVPEHAPWHLPLSG